MNPVEYRAETVEEAIRLAQADLGAYDDEMQVTVKEKGSKGFLGILQTLGKKASRLPQGYTEEFR